MDLLFAVLEEYPRLHAPTSSAYRLVKSVARSQIEGLFSGADRISKDFGPFGALSMPYTRMGAIDSLDLFGLDELIIFAFYHRNRERYRRVLDIGANLGLHSVIMDRCGFQVRAFEPDPWHFSVLTANLVANGSKDVDAIQAAVSTSDGEAEFVRVLGNTTGSHLAGSKDSYGEREYFSVPTKSVLPLFESADLAKIDAEGHEKELLLSTTREVFNHLDIIVEIGNPGNAAAIFGHCRRLEVGMFAQKIGWHRVESLADVPTSHREGSVFLSTKSEMPW
jgi:FkbM family methyltransferase